MKREPACIEAMWSCKIGIWDVRLWITQHHIGYMHTEDEEKLVRIKEDLLDTIGITMEKIIEGFVDAVPALAAIEVKNQNGEGNVIYLEWP